MSNKKKAKQQSEKSNISLKKEAEFKKRDQVLKILRFAFFIIIFSLLFINLFSSQLISPLYFQLVNDDKKAAVEFLKKIKSLPEFEGELEKYKKIYGKTVEEEVFAKEKERKQLIKKLEQILEKNPKARDVLYSLHLLYQEEGGKIKGEDYLRRAKEVDPNVKKLEIK